VFYGVENFAYADKRYNIISVSFINPQILYPQNKFIIDNYGKF